MAREIVAEIGTTGETGTVRVGDPRAMLARALDLEHTGAERSSTCDVCEAVKHGYVYSAAHLLQGATETPLLDAVAAHIGGVCEWDGWPQDWTEWQEHHRAHARECLASGCVDYDAAAYACAHCGGDLTPPGMVLISVLDTSVRTDAVLDSDAIDEARAALAEIPDAIAALDELDGYVESDDYAGDALDELAVLLRDHGYSSECDGYSGVWRLFRPR